MPMIGGPRWCCRQEMQWGCECNSCSTAPVQLQGCRAYLQQIGAVLLSVCLSAGMQVLVLLGWGLRDHPGSAPSSAPWFCSAETPQHSDCTGQAEHSNTSGSAAPKSLFPMWFCKERQMFSRELFLHTARPNKSFQSPGIQVQQS